MSSVGVPATVPASQETAWDTAISPEGRSHFRPDIEGLRAVAILAVLAYHAGIPGVPGGFVGVDVFFVISGFLITGLLLRELTTMGHVDLPAFYARRARRLLPAALVVAALTVAASALILSVVRFPDVALDGAAAALYVSNYRFVLSATDYFAVIDTASPLLHYWSLGVEEQFYLFWPLLIMAGWRLAGVHRLWLVVLGVALGSFALSVAVTHIEAPWAFYSLPTRAWQLALGGLIALGVISFPDSAPRHVMSGVGALGLVLVVAGVLLIDEATPFPGFAALLPAVGTALVIVGGERAGALSARLLATRLPRWVGRISYSLYLWHWPVIILVPELLGQHAAWLRLGLALVAVGLAALSTRLIEDPIRFGRIARLAHGRTLVAAGVASVLVAGVTSAWSGAVFAPGTVAPIPSFAPAAEGRPPELPDALKAGPLPEMLRQSLRAARDDVPAMARDGCHADGKQVEPPVCTYGAKDGSTTVVLFGDSHAMQWMPALDLIAQERQWRLLPLTKGSCPPVDVTVWHRVWERPYTECDAWRELALQRIATEQPEIVLVASSLNYSVVEGDRRTLAAAGDAVWRDGLSRTLARVGSAADRVILVAETPHLGTDPLECLATSQAIEDCVAHRDQVVDAEYGRLEIEAARSVGAAIVSPNEWICGADTCPLVIGDYLVYRDTAHLTATFASALAPHLAWALDHVRAEAGIGPGD